VKVRLNFPSHDKYGLIIILIQGSSTTTSNSEQWSIPSTCEYIPCSRLGTVMVDWLLQSGGSSCARLRCVVCPCLLLKLFVRIFNPLIHAPEPDPAVIKPGRPTLRLAARILVCTSSFMPKSTPIPRASTVDLAIRGLHSTKFALLA